MFRIIAVVLFTLSTLFQLFIYFLNIKASDNHVPSIVKDVYDEKQYALWKRYNAEHTKLNIYSRLTEYVIVMIYLVSPLFVSVSNAVGGDHYLRTLVLLAIIIGVDFITNTFFSYISNMKIEEKYGFNRMTKAIFIKDSIKSLIISTFLILGLTMAYVALHQSLKDWILIVFSAILIIIVLFIAFISPKLTRISYKMYPLEDGELKTKLTDMLTKHGYHIRSIEVIKASEKTTKGNAAFAGFGKMKTIMIYDNLLNKMSTDEILAVFAHEMGHGLHKDILKGQLKTMIMLVVMVALLWLTTKFPEIYQSFGFNDISYPMTYILFLYVELGFVSPLIGLITNYSTRKQEYLADKQAVEEGYGEALISGLKKLTADNFGNLAPHHLVVKLTYSHPTLAQRIAAINRLMGK